MAFYSMEPWGSDHEQLGVGVIAATIANCNRDPKKTPRPFSPIDFMPAARRSEARNRALVEGSRRLEKEGRRMIAGIRAWKAQKGIA